MGEFIVKDLGAVSGYAIAVEHGFVGTEQDWINFITGSTDAAVLSESYAKGGTGTRTGEDTDNAKYYAERSEHFATAPEWAEVQHKPNTLAGYGVSEVPTALLDGVIGIEHIPQGALERVISVADDTARFALTTSDVQLGDTVKVLSTGLMYAVIDTAHLDSESGYTVYTAGTAASAPWSGITGKPNTVSGFGITDAYTKTEMDTSLGAKVDKVQGKGLSTEDYTTSEKSKLSGIENDADVNIIESVKVNGTALTPDSNKAVNITLGVAASHDVASSLADGDTDLVTSDLMYDLMHDNATEETAQALLAEEVEYTAYETAFLDELDEIFSNLPQESTLAGIKAELDQEYLYLEQLCREVKTKIENENN